MACSLQPECNFLHGYFRCRLPVEVVDVELKITSMQGMHIFQRDRTTQLIKCTPWSTRLSPHPTIVKKMRTFLEVEAKMGPIPQPTSSQYRPFNQTQTLISGRVGPQIRERGQYPPKDLGPVTNSNAPINVKPQAGASENRPPTLRRCPSL